MARHEHLFETKTARELADDEVALLVAAATTVGEAERSQALAKFLSCSQGFDEAARALGGCFAGLAPLTAVNRD